ncbi:GGDEF domain-containing protein [Marinomonas sp. THO17]|uniref:GGDEF domain-containing protein n=1 Tax=Marinomonas sp. THO17 TaxID=3149048 RepID=UPI00336BD9BE
MSIKALFGSTDLYKQFVELAPVLFFAVDRNLKCTYINNRFATIHGVSQEEAVGLHLAELIGETSFKANLNFYKKALSGKTVKYKGLTRKSDGKQYYYSATYEPFILDGELVGFTGTVQDRSSEYRLAELSDTDSLTGLRNRRKFDRDLRATLRKKGQSALVMMDLDHFKAINDNFGHDVGDEVLVKVSRFYKKYMRHKDVVYRIGGEEFAIILHNNDIEDNELAEYCNQLCRRLANTSILQDHPITLSIGATKVLAEDNASSLMRRADKAMYQAKYSGRNQVSII